MDTQKVLRGIELRYVLTIALTNGAVMTVAELAEELTRQGFAIGGQRPSKAISDALRWEANADRVVRVGHGSYAPGYMPRATEHRIRKRVAALQAQVRDPAGDIDDDEFWRRLG